MVNQGRARALCGSRPVPARRTPIWRTSALSRHRGAANRRTTTTDASTSRKNGTRQQGSCRVRQLQCEIGRQVRRYTSRGVTHSTRTRAGRCARAIRRRALPETCASQWSVECLCGLPASSTDRGKAHRQLMSAKQRFNIWRNSPAAEMAGGMLMQVNCASRLHKTLRQQGNRTFLSGVIRARAAVTLPFAGPCHGIILLLLPWFISPLQY